MMIDKISEGALNKHANNPDVPNLSAEELKAFFDQPAEVLREKINEMIGAGNAPALSTLAEQLTEKSDALMAQIEEQKHKEISFENGECIGMAGELPDGVLLFGKSVQDNGDVYDPDIDCQILIPAPEEPDGLIVEYGSVGFKRTDAEGNYALWILHKNQSAQISLIYRDPHTGYGIVRQLSSLTDTELKLSGVAADALATGLQLMGLDARLEATKEDFEDFKLMEFQELKQTVTDQGETLDNMMENFPDDTDGAVDIIGEIPIEDLPVGLSYAAGEVTLMYLSNGEDQIYSPLEVGSGSAIIKTVGLIQNDSNESRDDAITVYVLPKHSNTGDDYGNHGTLYLQKIIPFWDMYGLQYSLSEIKYNIEVADRISDDPDYAAAHPNHVPSVGAVASYINTTFLGGEW